MTLLTQFSDAVFALDSEWKFTFVNDEAAGLFNDESDSLLGESIWDRFPVARETPFYDHYRAALENGDPQTIEAEFEPWNRWFREHLYPSENGLVIVSHEITDERRREVELERSRELLRHTVDLARVGGWEIDADDGLQKWTAETYRIHDLDPDGAYQPTVEKGIEFYHPSSRSTIEAAVEKCLTHGEPFDVELRIETAADRRKWIRARGEAIRDDTEIVGARGAIQDITDQKERANTVTELHEVAADLAAATDRRSIYERTIEAADSLLNFNQAVIAIAQEGSLRGVAMSEDVAFDDPPEMSIDEGIAGRTYHEQRSFQIDDPMAHPDTNPQIDVGSALSAPVGTHGVFQVMSDTPGTFDQSDLELAELLARHLESALDIADREAELQRQNDRLEEFASLVSHDLRGPLNVAAGRVELALESEDIAHLSEAQTALIRMEELIDDLLSLAQKGSEVRETEPIDLAALSRGCWNSVAPTEATLDIRAQSTIHGDRPRVKRCFENLLRNAIEHGGSDVTVTVGDLDAGFFIADDGPGIPSNERDTVFEAGYTTATDGTGFGLAIVREIVEAHNWDIGLTTSEAGGARFEITGCRTEA